MAQTLGVIVGNRGFFPDELAREGREKVLAVLEDMGFDVVTLSPGDTKFGTVETFEDAEKCARLFDQYRKDISGIIVTLPNFGDEKGVAYAIRLSGLNVPVLVHAFPDRTDLLDVKHRRDSFCGKLSVCNNLKQFGIPFSLTTYHTEDPDSEVFRKDIEWFAGVCRVVQGFKNLKAGAIGARPNAFNTVRFSEKILERHGISVEVADLSEIIGACERLQDGDQKVQEKLAEIKGYLDTSGVPEQALVKIAKLAVVLDEWIARTGVRLVAIQCWTSIEENFGIMPCTAMSMLSERLIPAACEVDLTGALGMYALQLASGKPSALVDWNNNFNDDPDKAILFHCSNFPKSLLRGIRMGYGDIISSTLPKEQTYGTCYGTIPEGPVTLSRLATDDTTGSIVAYVAEGEITQDEVKTFGGIGVVKVEGLQELLAFLCENGFEHHVAINLAHVGEILVEAFDKYLGFDTYWHNEA
ncbi:L-fucose/L-arabinose isomerase family protein [Candidatus Caldatribacterium saccharofermentans]|uniref:L-fucose/L-arabinose isomerase family protein n=1 Tax=Candidatus Caldatribacterium saccharofermentans TaxID=1454753 RepID=UPI003CFE83B2